MIAAALFERSLNHLLRQSPGAAEVLRRHRGRSVRFDLVAAQFDLRIADDGYFSESVVDVPDAVIRPTASLLARLPFFGREALRDADYSGDSALLHSLDQVFRSLEWDAEADLAPLVGDISAHRIAGAGQEVLKTLQNSARALGQNTSEYLVEEIELMARKVDVARFNRAVDTLADDVARLEASLAQLEKARR